MYLLSWSFCWGGGTALAIGMFFFFFFLVLSMFPLQGLAGPAGPTGPPGTRGDPGERVSADEAQTWTQEGSCDPSLTPHNDPRPRDHKVPVPFRENGMLTHTCLT